MDQISRVYARSLFEVAVDRDAVDRVREQVGQLAEGLDESRDLQLFLFSPQFSSAEKRDGLRRAIEGADPIVELLPEIRRAFDELYDDLHRVLPVRITTAVPLDEATTARIGEEVGRGTGRE